MFCNRTADPPEVFLKACWEVTQLKENKRNKLKQANNCCFTGRVLSLMLWFTSKVKCFQVRTLWGTAGDPIICFNCFSDPLLFSALFSEGQWPGWEREMKKKPRHQPIIHISFSFFSYNFTEYFSFILFYVYCLNLGGLDKLFDKTPFKVTCFFFHLFSHFIPFAVNWLIKWLATTLILKLSSDY